MREMNVDVVVDARAELGEGPVWDSRSECLFWVDIEAGKLHAHEPRGEPDRVWDVGCKVGAAVPREVPGEMILATAHGFELFDLNTSRKTRVADPESDLPDNRFNDGKCDSEGRFWAGTMSMVRQPGAASLYVLSTDRVVQKVFDGVTTSNGLDWSPDQRSMYYIDTPTMKVRKFDFDSLSGTIADERVVVEFPDGVGRPDGMTVDAEGMLWIAHWDGGRVSRWNPDTGKLLDMVRLPVNRVTSCAFGGSDLKTLFVTTARHGLDEAALAQQPHAGSLFAVRPGVGGRIANRYAG
ncbi:MAG: SMP-30/gluconolactonase/LRE family protein [Planctomycetota bacterium]